MCISNVLKEYFMTNKQSRNYIISAFVVVMIPFFSVKEVGAKANSAQRYFYGETASGVALLDDESPLVITNERLVFDIQGFSHGKIENRLINTVKAEYTIHNPSEYTVTSDLVFPFSQRINYLTDGEYQEQLTMYDVTIDDEEVTKSLRHSFMIGDWHNFELEANLSLISDDKLSAPYFNQGTIIYKYDFMLTGAFQNQLYTTEFSIPEDYRGIVLCSKPNVYFHATTHSNIGVNLYNKDTFSLYLIGENIKNFDNTFRVFLGDNGPFADEAYLDIKTDTWSDEQFVASHYSNLDTLISSVDKYNGVVGYLRFLREEQNMFFGDYRGTDFSNDLLTWYEYQIQLTPNQTIVNSVTAPIFPTIDNNYDPVLFEYHYLVSPASTWTSFANLEIVINTPYYVLKSSYGDFNKTDNGYVLQFSSLPDGELIFLVSRSQKPISRSQSIITAILYFLSTVGLGILFLMVLIGLVVISVILLTRKPKR